MYKEGKKLNLILIGFAIDETSKSLLDKWLANSNKNYHSGYWSLVFRTISDKQVTWSVKRFRQRVNPWEPSFVTPKQPLSLFPGLERLFESRGCSVMVSTLCCDMKKKGSDPFSSNCLLWSLDVVVVCYNARTQLGRSSQCFSSVRDSQGRNVFEKSII